MFLSDIQGKKDPTAFLDHKSLKSPLFTFHLDFRLLFGFFCARLVTPNHTPSQNNLLKSSDLITRLAIVQQQF